VNNTDKYSDLVPKYLKQQLSGDELAEFEHELNRNESLRSEVLELSRLYVGMQVSDRLDSGHIPSVQLVAYAENQDGFDSELRSDIEEHLRSCPDCSEELRLCRESIGLTGSTDESSESVIVRMFRAIFQPRLSIRPVWAYVATLLIFALGYYGARDLWHPISGVVVFELDPTAARGEESENVVFVREGSAVVRLEFRAVVSGDLYDLEILRPDGSVVIAKPSNITPEPSQNLFAFEVPTSYLPEGRYFLNVNEMDSTGKKLCSRVIEFEIKIE
jgi:hypothetical protein